ncbi:MAG: hypothetical protein ACM3XN_09625 [Chloroflexota bacterium]
MQPSDDLLVRRYVVNAVDRLPPAPANLRAATLARFRAEVAELGAGRTAMSGKRALALMLGFLPALVAWPLAAALGIERPLAVSEAVTSAPSIRLISRLLSIA